MNNESENVCWYPIPYWYVIPNVPYRYCTIPRKIDDEDIARTEAEK